MLDPGGHVLDVSRSDCRVQTTAQLVNGQPVPFGPLDSVQKEQLGNPRDTVRIKIDWIWKEPQSRQLVPESFQEVCSQHFRIFAVPFWRYQTTLYLAQLERCWVANRAVTGRPGPNFTRVDWRHNSHDARALIGRAEGGQTDLWMSMPFVGYENCMNPYEETVFMKHEMLHTFGYGHGEEMDRMEQLAGVHYRLYRWYLVDNPQAPP